MRKRLILGVLTGMLLLPFTMDTVGQTVVFDGEIYWEWEHDGNDYGGYGFYWWHQTDNPNLGDMPADDWLSPDNYFDGEWHMRFEILDQPTDEPFYIQFGIWQDKNRPGGHLEQVCGRKYMSVGSVFDADIGKPTDWWSLEPEKLDFSRPEDFYRIGLILWNTSPLCIPKDLSWGSDGCPEYADDFFPMRARVTITAGTGSGGGGGDDNPDYGVDYNRERTKEQVSDEHQWSWDNSTWTDGNNDYLDLSPDTVEKNVYFRVKSDYNKKQTLTVKARPDTPEFTIDYVNEQTAEEVSSDYWYATLSDLSDSVMATGDHLELMPGTTRYFMKRWTWSTFRSEAQELEVPNRPVAPVYTIDYANEQTGEAVPATDEYGSMPDMSDAVAGTGVAVGVTPGDTLYFRTSASSSSFGSATSQLVAPDRTDTPSFAIDFALERTSGVVETVMEVASSADMAGAVPGPGDYLDVVPGNDLYFRQMATGSSFSSGIQELLVPGRPDAPSYGIDFINETTDAAVEPAVEYATQADMSDAVAGTGAPAGLTPGEDLHFRMASTGSSFASENFTLSVPERPSVPAYTVDYINETTAEVVAATDEYADNPEMTGAMPGAAAQLALTPGTDLYLRTMSTASSFSSEIQTLDVPDRPAAPLFTIDFGAETTGEEISGEYIYSASADMSGAMPGTGAKLTVSPDTELHFQKAATAGAFASDIQSIILPARGAAPDITIDFTAESTAEAVTSEMEYSTYAHFDPVTTGSGFQVPVIPGDDLYLRVRATMDSFASDVRVLDPPLRPVITMDDGETTENDPFTAAVVFFQAASGLSTSGITALNGTVEDIQLVSTLENSTVYEATVSPLAGGNVSLQVQADVVVEGNFLSTFSNIYYSGVTGTPGTRGLEQVTLYPNPTTGRIKVFSPLLEERGAMLGIYSLTGELLISEQPAAGSGETEMDLGHLGGGIYILKITSGSGSVTRKVIMQDH